MPTAPADLLAEVDSLFCSANAPYGRYTRPSGSNGEVVIAGAMFRFALIGTDSQRVTLQVYKNINTIGGALWTREVRALLRLSSRGHPAIPTIVAGAYVEKNDLAFVITEAAQYRLSDDGAMAFVAQRPEEALRQLALLAHGLSLLHEQGITHRNLHPGAIEYVELGAGAGEDARYALRLSRFEMSAMLGNLVRRQLAGERLPYGDLRRIYLDGAPETLAYCPPERAEWLFGPNEEPPFLESDRSDVYALGVLAWRWLVEHAERRHPSTPATLVEWRLQESTLAAVRNINHAMRDGLTQRQVPKGLNELIRSMLAWDPRDRPSVVSVLQQLTHDYGRLVASLAPVEDAPLFHVGFMPEQSRATVYKWGWIDQDPQEEQGREQLRAFLEAELDGAEVLYCPEGFSGYQKARDDREHKAFSAAKYVLAGKQAYWFCDIWHERGPAFSKDDRRVDQLLVIKYVRHHHRAWRLAETPLRRRVPGKLCLVPVWTQRPLDLAEVRTRGSRWSPLLTSVEFERATPAWMQRMDDALSFLLAFRSAELDGRQFPYELTASAADTFELRLDLPRDRKLAFGDPLRALYYREMRLPMGRLFEGLDSERTAVLEVFSDAEGRPDFRGGAVARVAFDRRLDDDTISVRVLGDRTAVPKFGWIRPGEDQGSHSQLRQQEDAVEELLRARPLLHQLHAPTAIRGIRDRWNGVGEHLSGRGAEIVKDILSSEPFFALHGPPGTGKTTVASVAVAAHLRADPSQRVLVSSQSHYALDNLAKRILAQCRADALDVVAIRVASAHAVADEKVDEEVEHLLVERQAARLVEGIQNGTQRALLRGSLHDGRLIDNSLRPVLAEWGAQAPRVELEIRDRIRRGANLVFATTGGCTPRNVATGGSSGLYDWVIVEEAARAWPTELALPLVRGLRWTLIGDHFQLPAFDELSVQKFLRLCAEAQDEDLQRHGENRAAYLEVFSAFGNLFDQRAKRRRTRPASDRLVEPLDELDLQFRMHPNICRVVSKAFYRVRIDPVDGAEKTYAEGWLKSEASKTAVPHGVHAPKFLQGRAVVWIDTSDVEDTNDVRAWRNQGEAKIVSALLQRMHPVPGRDKKAAEDAFALLSPYHAQIAELHAIGLPSWTAGRVHTVDSFQGREADVVVTTLVRATQRNPTRPESNIGHLASPNRVNVLLSRARKLLIIVGRLEHFEQQASLNPDRKDVQFWKTIAEEVRRQGGVVSAAGLVEGADS